MSSWMDLMMLRNLGGHPILGRSLQHFRTSAGIQSFPGTFREASEFRALLSSSRVGSLSISSNIGKHSVASSASLANTFSLELPLMQQIPLSTLLKWSSGEAEANTFGSSPIAGVTRTCLSIASTPDFSSRLTPEAFFPCLDMAVRQRRFKIRVFLLLDGLPSQSDELHLPKATDFKAPETRLQNFSCQ